MNVIKSSPTPNNKIIQCISKNSLYYLAKKLSVPSNMAIQTLEELNMVLSYIYGTIKTISNTFYRMS
jgi:hypothetical protein